MKLLFYHYILQQKENSLLFTVFKAQKENPKRGEWYSEVHNILKEFDIILTELTLELKDYLKSWSNLRIEEERFIFRVKSEMNPLKSNFKRNYKMEAEGCIKNAEQN